MPAAAHILRKKNHSRQPIIPFRKPNVARECKPPGTFYRPRDHESSPFFKVVRDHFDEFERVYPEKFQAKYGFWRPIIRTSIDKFRKCGDLKEGLLVFDARIAKRNFLSRSHVDKEHVVLPATRKELFF